MALTEARECVRSLVPKSVLEQAVSGMKIPIDEITRIILAVAPVRVDISGWVDTWFMRSLGYVLNFTVAGMDGIVTLLETREQLGNETFHYYTPNLEPDVVYSTPGTSFVQSPGSLNGREDCFFRLGADLRGMKSLPAGRSLYASVTSLAPPKAGLGGSAALRVSMLAGIDAFVGNTPKPGNYYLGVREVACGMMGEQAGVQDEKAAEDDSSVGLIRIDPDEFPHCTREEVAISDSFRDHAESCWFILHLGGQSKESGERHKEVIKRAESSDPKVSGYTHQCLREISACSLRAVEAMKSNDLRAFEAEVAKNNKLVYEMCGAGPGRNIQRLQEVLPKGVAIKEPGAWRDNTGWVLLRDQEERETVVERIEGEILPEMSSSARIIPFRFADRGVRVAEFRPADFGLD